MQLHKWVDIDGNLHEMSSSLGVTRMLKPWYIELCQPGSTFQLELAWMEMSSTVDIMRYHDP